MYNLGFFFFPLNILFGRVSLVTCIGIVDTFSLVYNIASYEYTTTYPFCFPLFLQTVFCSLSLNILDQKCKKQIAIQVVVTIHIPTSSEEKI